MEDFNQLHLTNKSATVPSRREYYLEKELCMHHTALHLIQDAVSILEEYYQAQLHATHVAWWLLEAVTKKTRLQIVMIPNFQLTPAEEQQMRSWLIKHTQEDFPLQYLIGSVPFGPLDILVEQPILIPRPETEQWCASLISNLQRCVNEPLTILDMCTGSGCIGLWLAKALPLSTVYAVDISDQALALAQKNALHNNITNIHFLRSNLFDVFTPDRQFDLIVSNPPYISPEAWSDLAPMVKHWEDRSALVAGQQGLEILHELIQKAPYFLKRQSPVTREGIARLVLEIGYDQGEKVGILCKNRGFGIVKVLADDAGRDRVVCAW